MSNKYHKKSSIEEILDWPKTSFGLFHNILHKNPNEYLGQPKIYVLYITSGQI